MSVILTAVSCWYMDLSECQNTYIVMRKTLLTEEKAFPHNSQEPLQGVVVKAFVEPLMMRSEVINYLG